jgi:hypothetical protein
MCACTELAVSAVELVFISSNLAVQEARRARAANTGIIYFFIRQNPIRSQW